MAINERVMRLLEQHKVEYEVLPHREAYTSQEVAETVHVKGCRVAKVVVAREPSGSYLMLVVPATCKVDLALLSRQTGRAGTMLAHEEELQRLFPDCELGAMPPFGRLYGMPMYLDRCFRRSPEILFQAGNHHEVVRMDLEDFLELARPLAGEVCLHPEYAHA
jgi:Ala-tRNA(Pro) deacylase